jgi:16S rRNA (uracil1498-N3)-methyltransferase
MARFYVPNPRIEKEKLKIEGGEVKHIRKVLRLRTGDEIHVFDGTGKEYEGTIIEENASMVVMKIHHVFSSDIESALEIILAQSLLKGEKMDYLIQKATELGIKEIIPFFSSRSVPVLEKSSGLKRYHRWDKIAVEASKQSGRTVVPKLNPPRSYSEILRIPAEDSLRLILWEKRGMQLKNVLEANEKKKIFFIIGPEGGFCQKEVNEAERMGSIPIHLGKRILRAETASLCLLSILQYVQGDVG